MTLDMINHPPHYSAARFGVECIEFTRHMTFTAGNAFKYVWRAEEKGTLASDLGKARLYLAWAEDELYPSILSGVRGTQETIMSLAKTHLIPKILLYWEVPVLLHILEDEFIKADDILTERQTLLESSK